jgi:hypothetical protein
MGMDLSPDGMTLIVADLTQSGPAGEDGGTDWIHVVDLASWNPARSSSSDNEGRAGPSRAYS